MDVEGKRGVTVNNLRKATGLAVAVFAILTITLAGVPGVALAAGGHGGGFHGGGFHGGGPPAKRWAISLIPAALPSIASASTSCPWRASSRATCTNWAGKFWWMKRKRLAMRGAIQLFFTSSTLS